MSEVALLNPAPPEDGAAKDMLMSVKTRRERLEKELSTTVLDREQYLVKIGASRELTALEAEMQRAFDRRYKV
jgi:hypothetical protein